MRRIETLSQFIEWAARFKNGRYLFRGVPKDLYKIEAAAYRRLKTNKTVDQLLKVNQELIKDARARGHDQKNGQELFDLELLAELQHFGAATCLIDFSRNALIALWFACQQESAEKETNGKVFAVPDVVGLEEVTPDLIKEKIDHFFKPDEHGKYKWEPKLQNNRIIAQHSVFVFGRDQIEAETECVIMLSSKREMLKSLGCLFNITEASMYPDFDGFARLYAHDKPYYAHDKPYIEPDAQDYFLRGIEVHQRGNLDDAITCYTVVIELDSDPNLVSQAYVHRGLAYQRKGEFSRAIDDFTRLMEIGPNHICADAYKYRGVVYLQKGERDCAIRDFSEAIELNPNHIDAYYDRAMIYMKKGNHELAVEDFRKVVQLHVGYTLNPIVQYYHGIAWLFLGEWENARRDLTYAKDRGIPIAVRFQDDYGSVADFQRSTGMPEDLAEMLIP